MQASFVRRFGRAVGSAMLLGATAGAVLAADVQQIAYVRPVGDDTNRALLIEWIGPQRARLVTDAGAQLGTAASDKRQTVITLDTPIVQTDFTGDPDSCDFSPVRRKEITRVVVRDTSGGQFKGRSQVVEIGTRTALEGCDEGIPKPFGSLSSEGVTLNRIAVSARSTPTAIEPGSQWAGFSEEVWAAEGDSVLPVDIATFYAGGLAMFAATGSVVPVESTPDGWLVFRLPGFERAYALVDVDHKTGAETWLRADRAGGLASRVVADYVVRISSEAGFVSQKDAARKWEAGLFAKTRQPFAVHLYEDGTGERISTDLLAGTTTRTPITWFLSGRNLVQKRQRFDREQTRTWVPLHSRGPVQFVLESEIATLADGTSFQFLAPRINFYIDSGKAVAPR